MEVEKSGEGLRIHISEATKRLLDDFGGFRIEYRGVLDLGVIFSLFDNDLFSHLDFIFLGWFWRNGYFLVDWN